MIKNCLKCNKEFYTYPCRIKIGIGKYCSKRCSNSVTQNGKECRFKKGHIPSANRIMPYGDEHPLWKGDGVGYRGLHYWLRRVKGKPLVCEECGADKTTPKSIQWANISGFYFRNPNDYMALCSKCHKEFDMFKVELFKL